MPEGPPKEMHPELRAEFDRIDASLSERVEGLRERLALSGEELERLKPRFGDLERRWALAQDNPELIRELAKLASTASKGD